MIHREDRDSIAVLRLEHGKANALDVELLRELRLQLEDLPGEAKALVLTGSGTIFSAGIDLPRLLGEGVDYVEPLIDALNDLLERFLGLSLPIVAAVNGHAIAGGFVLACGCDVRLMASGVGKVGLTELRVGVPFPPAVLAIVGAVVGRRELREMVYRARLYSAAEAVQRGMADELVPPGELLDRAVETATELGAISPGAFALTKRQLLEPMRRHLEHLGASFEQEVRQMWGDETTRAGIRRFVQERLG